MKYSNFNMNITGPQIGGPSLMPVSGHPYVRAWSGQLPNGQFKIYAACSYCGDKYERDCQYPDKAPVWVARYCALHSHGMTNIQQQFEQAYHVGLQQFNMRHRGY
jgi:hypothetical protein